MGQLKTWRQDLSYSLLVSIQKGHSDVDRGSARWDEGTENTEKEVTGRLNTYLDHARSLQLLRALSLGPCRLDRLRLFILFGGNFNDLLSRGSGHLLLQEIVAEASSRTRAMHHPAKRSQVSLRHGQF